MQYNSVIPVIQIVALLLVILGWFINNREANKREERKELKEFLASTTSFIKDIECLAIEYHTGEEADVTKSAQIKSGLMRLSRRCALLDGSTHNTQIIKIRKAITKMNFDSAGFKGIKRGDQKILEMSNECNMLINNLERNFIEKYHKKRCFFVFW